MKNKIIENAAGLYLIISFLAVLVEPTEEHQVLFYVIYYSGAFLNLFVASLLINKILKKHALTAPKNRS